MKNELKKFIVFLGEHKQYVGFGDWDISLIDSRTKESSNIAWTTPNIEEKELEVELLKGFFELSEEKQKNVLFHELLHGRVCAFNLEARDHNVMFEENMVNDITRGFEHYKGFEWKNDKEYVVKKEKNENAINRKTSI